MAVVEQYPLTDDFESMPKPGTIHHLEWLSGFEVPAEMSFEELQDFLHTTQAVNSFVEFTRQHNMVPHIPRRFRREFDTRFLELGPDWQQEFRVATEISPEPHMRDHGQLIIHGQPEMDNLTRYTYAYDVVLPVKDQNYHDPSYDPARPMQSVYDWYVRGERIPARRRSFNQMYQPAQGEPIVVAQALQEAAKAACDLYRYLYGDDMALPPMEPSSPELARWHPDYAVDDPGEFLKAD